MSQSGGRRIMRSYEVSLSNIRPCTPEYLEEMKNEFDLLHDYIIKKQEQKTAGKEVNTETVRTLAPTQYGLPLQIYCFSSNKNWVSYESIQAAKNCINVPSDI